MLQQTQTDCLGQIRLHALCYSSLGQNYSTALGPEQWSVAIPSNCSPFNSQKMKKKRNHLSLTLLSLLFLWWMPMRWTKQVNVSTVCQVRISKRESNKEWQEEHFSRGVNYWELWCFLPTTALQRLLNFKCHISWNNLRLCWECICVCTFVLWGRVLCLWGRTDETIFVSSITFMYSKWFFNKLRGDG